MASVQKRPGVGQYTNEIRCGPVLLLLLLLYKIYVLSKKVSEHGLADSSIKHKL